MEHLLSIRSLFTQAKSDFFKNLNAYVVFACLQTLLFPLSLLIFNKGLLIEVITGFSHIFLIYAIYTIKIKSISLSFLEFFTTISGKKLVQLIGVVLLITLICTVGLIAFIIPGLILFIRLALAQFIIFEPHMTVINALKKSFSLTKGYTIQLSCIFLLILLIASLFTALSMLSIIPFFGLKALINPIYQTIISYQTTGGTIPFLFILIFFFISFFRACSVIFFLLIYGEIYKRLSENKNIASPIKQ